MYPVDKKLNVLIACEFSGTVRDAFIVRGHNAVSCDHLPTEKPGPHYQGDVFDIVGDGWDLMIAHPPCTFLSVSGLHWNKNNPARAMQTEAALLFVWRLMTCSIPRKAIENPISCISSRIRKPEQIIQPYQFGHDASKSTCLWLTMLEPLPLNPAKHVMPRSILHPSGEQGLTRYRWANQTDSGQNKLAPSQDRWKERSRTYQGIADAMAAQWG